MARTALICGVSGQDGAYLSHLLLDKGYRVVGTSRDVQGHACANLNRLGIQDRVERITLDPEDFTQLCRVLQGVAPNEVYNLSGQSSVGLSFEQPLETFRSISLATSNWLEAIRTIEPSAHFFNAGTSECFGDTGGMPADEKTPLQPQSPYAVAKSAAWLATSNYRESFGLFACTGILFNHESPLRPDRFVTQKIVQAVARIARGSQEKLKLGNLAIVRDWGWAPEYVEAMWRMLQQPKPEDYVVATGQSHALEVFVAAAFDREGLDWRDHVEFDPQLVRPAEVSAVYANPDKARSRLGWAAQSSLNAVVHGMVAAAGGEIE